MIAEPHTTPLCELSHDELACINGGTTDSVSMTMSSSADSLISLEFKWQQGDNCRSYKLSAGNNIEAGLNLFFNKQAN